MSDGFRVAVGVLTYRRPEMLAELLPLLEQQIAALPDPHTGHVIVVDNDPARSAAEVCAEHPEFVTYVSETTPGIAAARYRCLQEAAGFDLLQFLDDDEQPARNWLATMVETWDAWGRPAAVAGPVVPRYEQTPSKWIVAGGFFERRRYPTGTPLPAAPTSNLLLDVAQVQRLGVQFDRTLGLRGGEDTLFTRQLVANGGRIIFCDEAPVTDLVPADRAKRKWVLKRAYHHGSTHVFAELRGGQRGIRRLVRRAVFVAEGVARGFVGIGLAGWGLLTRDLQRETRGWRLGHRGYGMAIEALFGTQPEYHRKDSHG